MTEWNELRSCAFSQALRIACGAHRNQVDLSGAPYILHVIRVAQQMETPLAYTVAILHDALEDAVDPNCIREKIGEIGLTVLEAVEALTRAKDEVYQAYIRRVAAHPLARKVKIADLYDNLDPRRLPVRTAEDLARVLRYHQALEILL